MRCSCGVVTLLNFVPLLHQLAYVRCGVRVLQKVPLKVGRCEIRDVAAMLSRFSDWFGLRWVNDVALASNVVNCRSCRNILNLRARDVVGTYFEGEFVERGVTVRFGSSPGKRLVSYNGV